MKAIVFALTTAAVVALAFAEASDPPTPEGVVLSEFVFTDAPFAACHASTVAQTAKGTLVAAWFGGPREGNREVGIWLARRLDGRWTKPVQVADGVQSADERFPCWNPVLFQPKDGPLLLFYKVGPNPKGWWGMLTTSDDDGETWAPPRRLPKGMLGPIKNKPVQLPEGDLLCASSTEDDGWRVHFERTDARGKDWTATDPLNDGKEIAAIQPTILVHGDGRLQALGRSRQGKIWQAWSKDQGKTWTALELTDLPNPNSGIDAVTLADGRHLLVYNHTARDRSPLNVAVSEDGKAWKAGPVLEDGDGEYSYPAVVQAADGLVHVTYTWKRQRIKHVVLDPKKLTLADLPPAGQRP
jgi:predicted neuraminidase